MAGLKDDNEFLVGETRDLQIKLKEVCLQNANFKHLLAQLQSSKETLNDGLQMGQQSLIETARNLSDIDSDNEEPAPETTDFISEQDSFRKVMVDDSALNKQLETALAQISDLQEKLDAAEEQNEDESTAIQHIKGTLVQYLKQVPLTENGNEELLKIIYSMMEFAPHEI